jgi:hypothetical protein
MFSIITGSPASTANSIIFTIFGFESLVTFNPFGSQVLFNQLIPYNYGSIIKEYLSEFVRIAPFSVDTLSGGSPKLFHPATVASSVRIFNGLLSLLLGIPFLSKKGTKFSFIIISLYFLLNGPTYDTNDAANNTSPIITLMSSPISIID